MLLLSIRPQFVERIFREEKRVELRRRRPRCQPGDWIAIYSTAPVMSLSGIMRVSEIRVTEPGQMWEAVEDFAGISRTDFFEYFQNTDRAVGIMIDKSICFPTTVPLCDLRQRWPGFHPPQEFRYLTNREMRLITRLLGEHPAKRVAA